MSPSRREFIKQFGIALAGLLASRCVPRRSTPTPQILCYQMVALTPPPTADPTRQAEALQDAAAAGDLPPEATRQALAAFSRERLRACWLGLDALAERAADMEKGEWTLKSLTAEHRLALDDLVSLGELSEAVAAQVQIAFDEAAYHVWRSHAPITCYIASPPEMGPRNDLVQRAQTLMDVQDVDQATVEQVKSALERDIALLALLKSDHPDAAQLAEQWAAGEIQVDAETVAAAQFLIDLLLETL